MTKNPPRIDFSKKFNKQLLKSPIEIKIAFRNKLNLFIQNQFHPLLNNHSLIGKFSGFRSINITGDWRVIYKEEVDENFDKVVIFIALGTHSELYC